MVGRLLGGALGTSTQLGRNWGALQLGGGHLAGWCWCMRGEEEEEEEEEDDQDQEEEEQYYTYYSTLLLTTILY